MTKLPTNWKFIAFTALAYAAIFWPKFTTLPHGNIGKVDTTDAPMFAIGLAHAHPGAWLHGAWVGGNDFYRPLASLGIYAMYRAFGINGLSDFQCVLIISHAAACFVVFGLFMSLFRPIVATVAAIVFASGITDVIGLPSANYGINLWFDVLEPWVAIAILSSAWAMTHYLKSKNRIALCGSVALCVIACLIKETGFLTPLVILWILIVQKSKQWALAIPHCVTVAAIIVYRTIIFHGRGAHYGSNGSWLTRSVSYMFGTFGAQIVNHNLDSIVLAAFITAVALAAMRRKSAAVAAVTFIALLLADGYLLGLGAVINIARLTMPQDYPIALPLLNSMPLFVLACVAYFMRRSIESLQGLALAIILFLPLLTAPITAHALYQPAIGWALIFGGCLAAALASQPRRPLDDRETLLHVPEQIPQVAGVE